MTSELPERVYKHRHGLVPGFTRKHSLKDLVYCEGHSDVNQATLREKQINRWKRVYKFELVERMNPKWEDLFPSIAGQWVPAQNNAGMTIQLRIN